MEQQTVDELFTAAICQAEILSGIAVLPQGRRRHALEAAALAMFREDFAGRILFFDSAERCFMPNFSPSAAASVARRPWRI